MAAFDFIIDEDGRAKPVIPVTIFLTTEEEKAGMIESAKRGTLRLIEWHPIEVRDGEIVGLLPEDRKEVILTTKTGFVVVDVFCRDDDGCYFYKYDIDEVWAWMEMPEPYKPKEEEGTT